MHETARQGDKVKVHYQGRLDDGSVFDSSNGREPIEFTIGARQVIQGFEQAVLGMSTGETKSEEIPAEKAYGVRQDELVFEVPRTAVQPGMDLSVGDMVQVHLPDGQRPATVIEDGPAAVVGCLAASKGQPGDGGPRGHLDLGGRVALDEGHGPSRREPAPVQTRRRGDRLLRKALPVRQ